MTLEALTPIYPWGKYSKKLKEKIVNLRCYGFFTQKEAEGKRLRLVSKECKHPDQHFYLKLDWLVDEEDGRLVDAKFTSLAQGAMLGALEGACLWIIGKTYVQVSRMSAEVIDKLLQDSYSQQEAFPQEVASCVNYVVDVLEEMAHQCQDIPLSTELTTPLPESSKVGQKIDAKEFEALGLKAKLQVIKEVVEKEIQPYVALDGGGVEVLNIVNQHEVLIAYQGACVGCFASVGSTLNSIQQILNQHVHPELIVKPQL